MKKIFLLHVASIFIFTILFVNAFSQSPNTGDSARTTNFIDSANPASNIPLTKNESDSAARNGNTDSTRINQDSSLSAQAPDSVHSPVAADTSSTVPVVKFIMGKVMDGVRQTALSGITVAVRGDSSSARVSDKNGNFIVGSKASGTCV